MQQLSIFDEQETDQPRFRAYLNYTGKRSKNEVHMGDFMDWIASNLKEFKRVNKIGIYEALNMEQNEEFTKYLFEVKKEC